VAQMKKENISCQKYITMSFKLLM